MSDRDTDWFKNAKWGVFHHYLVDDGMSAEAWNARVDAFDAQAHAKRIADLGAGYYFFTIGQTSGHYCAPNETYDKIAGIEPGKCARRDLIGDLAEALNAHGIPMLVYSISQSPLVEPEKSRFGWEWGFDGPTGAWSDKDGNPLPMTGKRLADFQRKWEAVHREWSERWGKRVKGWWIDSCYFADGMYFHDDEPNFASFARALRAGNDDAIVAFNNGWIPPVTALTDEADYTAGEAALVLPQCPGRFTQSKWHSGTFPPPENKQFHVLSYLGPYWNQPTNRFPDEFVYGYTKHVIENGGVVSWDTAIAADGTIPEEQERQLRQLRDLR